MAQNGPRTQCVVKISTRQGLNNLTWFSYLYISYYTPNLIYIRCLQNVPATPSYHTASYSRLPKIYSGGSKHLNYLKHTSCLKKSS